MKVYQRVCEFTAPGDPPARKVAGDVQAFAPNDSMGCRLSRAIGNFVAWTNGTSGMGWRFTGALWWFDIAMKNG